jgi:hypothetical protein
MSRNFFKDFLEPLYNNLQIKCQEIFFKNMGKETCKNPPGKCHDTSLSKNAIAKYTNPWMRCQAIFSKNFYQPPNEISSQSPPDFTQNLVFLPSIIKIKGRWDLIRYAHHLQKLFPGENLFPNN